MPAGPTYTDKFLEFDAAPGTLDKLIVTVFNGTTVIANPTLQAPDPNIVESGDHVKVTLAAFGLDPSNSAIPVGVPLTLTVQDVRGTSASPVSPASAAFTFQEELPAPTNVTVD